MKRPTYKWIVRLIAIGGLSLAMFYRGEMPFLRWVGWSCFVVGAVYLTIWDWQKLKVKKNVESENDEA